MLEAGRRALGAEPDCREPASASRCAGEINPKADIGAHEVEQDEIIFGTDFVAGNGQP